MDLALYEEGPETPLDTIPETRGGAVASPAFRSTSFRDRSRLDRTPTSFEDVSEKVRPEGGLTMLDNLSSRLVLVGAGGEDLYAESDGDWLAELLEQDERGERVGGDADASLGIKAALRPRDKQTASKLDEELADSPDVQASGGLDEEDRDTPGARASGGLDEEDRDMPDNLLSGKFTDLLDEKTNTSPNKENGEAFSSEADGLTDIKAVLGPARPSSSY
jgi:hypothetical protein